eukprot:13626471-Ditylum_brightwellii.AAC.1
MSKRQDSAYLKLWKPELQLTLGWEAGVPSSTQVVDDMVWITEYSILKWFYVCGVVVHDCGTCRGRRQDGIRKG